MGLRTRALPGRCILKGRRFGRTEVGFEDEVCDRDYLGAEKTDEFSIVCCMKNIVAVGSRLVRAAIDKGGADLPLARFACSAALRSSSFFPEGLPSPNLSSTFQKTIHIGQIIRSWLLLKHLKTCAEPMRLVCYHISSLFYIILPRMPPLHEHVSRHRNACRNAAITECEGCLPFEAQA